MSQAALKDRPGDDVPAGDLYERDHYGWVEQQVALLRAGLVEDVDAPRIAAELAEIGRGHVARLENALKMIVVHMLKWDGRAEARSPAWQGSIREQRRRIVRLLSRNPSLKSRADQALDDAYEDAVFWAAEATGQPSDEFPRDCPYDWSDILERAFELDRTA